MRLNHHSYLRLFGLQADQKPTDAFGPPMLYFGTAALIEAV
jgi:hypothetical protein